MNVHDEVAAEPAVLVASAFGDRWDGGHGGGVFTVESSRAERIDRVSSMGLAAGAGRLARILRCPIHGASVAEVVIYDVGGVLRYVRLDDVMAAHDVAWDADDLVIVSTFQNSVRWFDPGGHVVREVRFAGTNDNWHLNCITRRGDRWYASMFGPVGPFSGSSPARIGAGRIVELTTGKEVVGGLSAPHTPRWLDEEWLVCDSARGELISVEEHTGRVTRRVACGDWTRGIAWDERFLYVGSSHRRREQDALGHAEIVVVGRDTWTVVERIHVPALEIYDLVFLPQLLHAGLRRGFDVNPLRTNELRQYRILSELGAEQPRTLWPSGDPLPWSDFRCTITATIPAACAGGTLLELPVTLTNRGSSFFTSAPPSPVYVSYKWIDPANGSYVTDARAHRSHLPRTVFPGETVDMTVRIVVPAVAGPLLLRVTPMQEGISWFDDQDPANALEATVAIEPAPATVWEPVVR